MTKMLRKVWKIIDRDTGVVERLVLAHPSVLGGSEIRISRVNRSLKSELSSC